MLAWVAAQRADVAERLRWRDDWLVGGPVCLDAACSASVPMFSAHWTPPGNAFGPVAQRTLDVLSAQTSPHVLLGDLNVYRVDPWNPDVPCTGPDVGGRVEAIQRMEAAGYIDAWKTTQGGEGWTGMATRNGCGAPNGNLFKRIDYVYTRNLRAVSTTRLARGGRRGCAVGPRDADRGARAAIGARHRPRCRSVLSGFVESFVNPLPVGVAPTAALLARENQHARDQRQDPHQRRRQPERHHPRQAVQNQPDRQHQKPHIALNPYSHPHLAGQLCN